MYDEREHHEDVRPYPPGTDEAEPAAPFSEQLGFGVGTFLAAGAVDLFAHFGLTGLVVGGITAYVASQHGPQMLAQVRSTGVTRPAPAPVRNPRQPVPRTLATERRSGRRRRSVLDRALGRFPALPEEAPEADEDTVLVQEDTDTWEDGRPAPLAVASRRRAGERQLTLSPQLRLPVGELAGKAIFICGIRRHGKTTLGALLAEQLGRYDLPLVIPDLEGDYLSLAEVLPRAVIGGHSRVANQYPASQFLALDNVQAAYQAGYETLQQGYQLILDLSSYSSLDDAIAIQINVIRGLFHWTNTHPGERVPCHVYLDEAQRYLPQNLSDSVILNRTVLSLLLKCYMDIIGTGGKRGLAPVILTQRFAQVNNKIMAQTEVFFLLRQTHDSDLDRCMEYADKTVVSKEQIARFAPGQGVFIGSDGTQIVTRFAPRRSSGERSQSPRPEAAARYAGRPLSLWRERAGQEMFPVADHPHRQMTMPPLEPIRQEIVAPIKQPEPSLLERGVAAYLDGATSQPKLAAALNISPWDARKLMPQVEAEVRRLHPAEEG